MFDNQHIHLFAAVRYGDVLPIYGNFGEIHYTRIYTDDHLDNLINYLSRPNDERATRIPKEKNERYSLLVYKQLEASELYLKTKGMLGGARLRRMRWHSNISKREKEEERRASDDASSIRLFVFKITNLIFMKFIAISLFQHVTSKIDRRPVLNKTPAKIRKIQSRSANIRSDCTLYCCPARGPPV